MKSGAAFLLSLLPIPSSDDDINTAILNRIAVAELRTAAGDLSNISSSQSLSEGILIAIAALHGTDRLGNTNVEEVFAHGCRGLSETQHHFASTAKFRWNL